VSAPRATCLPRVQCVCPACNVSAPRAMCLPHVRHVCPTYDMSAPCTTCLPHVRRVCPTCDVSAPRAMCLPHVRRVCPTCDVSAPRAMCLPHVRRVCPLRTPSPLRRSIPTNLPGGGVGPFLRNRCNRYRFVKVEVAAEGFRRRLWERDGFWFESEWRLGPTALCRAAVPRSRSATGH